MNEILIFGDSFADKNFRHIDEETWYDKLDTSSLTKSPNSTSVVNYAINGIGASRLIKIFEKEIRKYDISDLSDKFLVIVLSDCYKFDLDYLPDVTHAHYSISLRDFDNADEFIKRYHIKDHADFYRDNFERIKNDYNSFYSNGVNQLLPIHCIQYFLHMSSFFKKVIIWPSNEVYLQNEISKEIGCDFNMTEKLISRVENLYFVRKSFYEILTEQEKVSDEKNSFLQLTSIMSYRSDHHKSVFINDNNLNNHLTATNHRRIFHLIYNWFFKNKKVNYDN